MAGQASGESMSRVVTTHMADPEVYKAEARRHAEAGRFRDALRALFLTVLAELERAGLVAFDRTRTNGEYAQQLERRTGRGPVTENFRWLAQAFNVSWYGHGSSTREEFERFAARADQTVRLARERA